MCQYLKSINDLTSVLSNDTAADEGYASLDDPIASDKFNHGSKDKDWDKLELDFSKVNSEMFDVKTMLKMARESTQLLEESNRSILRKLESLTIGQAASKTSLREDLSSRRLNTMEKTLGEMKFDPSTDVVPKITADPVIVAERLYAKYFKELPPFDEEDVQTLGPWNNALRYVTEDFPDIEWMLENPEDQNPPKEIRIFGYKGRMARSFFNNVDFLLEKSFEKNGLVKHLKWSDSRHLCILSVIYLILKRNPGKILRDQIKHIAESKRKRVLAGNTASHDASKKTTISDGIPKRLIFYLQNANSDGGLDILLNPPEGKGSEEVVLDEVAKEYEKFCEENYKEIVERILKELDAPKEYADKNREILLEFAQEIEGALGRLTIPYERITEHPNFINWDRTPPKKKTTRSAEGRNGKSKKKRNQDEFKKGKKMVMMSNSDSLQPLIKSA
ncbi:uncharacterized protein CANTADRAFT_6380 [Suhomyces tanzawaensis NRRL Y-17324]|uniref:Uncharacterized protein n=1 Tax=Suhomyces tanzawaensis NRRL Y-17324 TaxID=984487 RepID=A0A1E4SIG4_9ASCO|nr:uncharacterized protein CANTADRAFT_6380 [Suhomyces tanzawaensis NRRL Y-17324]ODV79222.1 hypothetical protein CANTADRAFT_6380 [Suhomyces tanzawaensis NRRL Y-17324]